MRNESSGRADVEGEILSVAKCVCLDEDRALRWYYLDPIAALGNYTAAELVWRGEGERVLRFLRSVLGAELETLRAVVSRHIGLKAAALPG